MQPFRLDVGNSAEREFAFEFVGAVTGSSEPVPSTGVSRSSSSIDFHVIKPASTAPQQLILRVEEKKIVENPMGEDVMQLRWQLATVEEAKEVVVCWNKRKLE